MTAIAVSMQAAAEMLGLSEKRVRELVNKELIEARYEGRKRLVSVQSLNDYYKSLPTERDSP
jgi:hypothetical protein